MNIFQKHLYLNHKCDVCRKTILEKDKEYYVIQKRQMTFENIRQYGNSVIPTEIGLKHCTYFCAGCFEEVAGRAYL